MQIHIVLVSVQLNVIQAQDIVAVAIPMADVHIVAIVHHALVRA